MRPTEWLHEQISHVEQQVAAVRTVHRAGLDLSKIGDQHAMLRNVFDIDQKIAKGGMQFLNDRSGRAFSRMTDEDVDLVTLNGLPP